MAQPGPNVIEGDDDLVTAFGEQIEVREVVVHMIEEYARHCGHADLVREAVDGRAGESP